MLNLKDKVAVVTGGASGIGAEMSKRFANLGAKVVVADLDGAGAMALAKAIGGLGFACDVRDEAQIHAVVEVAKDQLGPIDLFFSNAGVVMEEPGHAASASNATWQACWEIHVMSHVFAARAVLPDMIARGEGILLNMASAAGLLSQIGDSAYSASKHAAVAFAESLAISHKEDGIHVAVVCPQYVATPLIGFDPAKEVAPHPMLRTVDQVADSILEGLADRRFLILPHEEVATYMRHKAGDYDRWLGGMRKLRRSMIDDQGKVVLDALYRDADGGKGNG